MYNGWLALLHNMMFDVPDQTAYFSEHYQRYGLNVEAVCDANCPAIYISAVVLGEINDAGTYKRLHRLIKWLESLPRIFHWQR